MPSYSWRGSLTQMLAAGTLFSAFTTAKTVLRPENVITLPENFFAYPGKKVRIVVVGCLSNLVTTPGTVTFQVMLGSVIAFTTGAIQMSSTVHTTVPFWLEIELTCLTVGNGTTATLKGSAKITSQAVAATAVADGTQTHTTLMCPNTIPAAGTGFDSTAKQALDFFTAFSVNNAANGVQIHEYDVIDCG
jgi:hypothetical protein